MQSKKFLYAVRFANKSKTITVYEAEMFLCTVRLTSKPKAITVCGVNCINIQ